MARGRLEIYGDVGAYLGQGMSGGRIELFGSAGVYAAAGMRGGTIHITADAGDFLGAALPGDPAGMAEGTVLVGGDAGDRVGDRMRRGLIAVHGRIGDYAASRMIGGTIVALAAAAAPIPATPCAAAALSWRPTPDHLLATFTDNGAHELPWLRLLARQLARPEPPSSCRPRVGRWTGCASVGGQGRDPGGRLT